MTLKLVNAVLGTVVVILGTILFLQRVQPLSVAHASSGLNATVLCSSCQLSPQSGVGVMILDQSDGRIYLYTEEGFKKNNVRPLNLGRITELGKPIEHP
jgi:hypothetical protein